MSNKQAMLYGLQVLSFFNIYNIEFIILERLIEQKKISRKAVLRS